VAITRPVPCPFIHWIRMPMRYLVLFNALALGVALQAQEPVYRWGEEATNDFAERRVERLLDLGDQGFVLLRVAEDATTVRHFWLERFDPALKSLGMQEIAFNNGVMGDAYFLDEVMAVNGGLYAFITHWDKAAGKHTLAVHGLGFDGVLGNGKELDVITAEKMGNRGSYHWSFSPDGNKLLVLAELPFVKGAKEEVRLSCFSVPNMARSWQQQQALEWEADKSPKNDIIVDDNGHAYLFKQTWQKPVWNYALYATDGKGTWKSHRPKGLEGKQVEDHRLAIGPDGKCFIYALYTVDPSSYTRKIHGNWYARFAADGTLAEDRGASWSPDLLAYMSGKKMAEKGDLSFVDDLHIKDILFRTDGRLLLLLERYKHSSEAVPGSSPMQFTYQWNYGDAVALCLEAASGDPVWWQVVEKQQDVRSNVSQDEFGSYVYFLKNDRLYVLWNNTDLSVPSIPPANWTEPDGTRYVKHKAFDTKTMHATFMQVIEPDGRLAYADRKFGLPLFHFHEGAVFEMSMTTPFFFDLNGDLVVLAIMHNGGKRYRFGFVGL
jgi:hypothetical protein